MSLYSELSRRNVFRVGVAYSVIAWVVAQVAEFAFESFGAPDWAIKSVAVLLLLGLPVVVVIAWAYEMTPDGLKREKDVVRDASITPRTGRRIDRVIIGTLVVALGFFVADKYVLQPGAAGTATPASEVAAAPVTDDGVPDNSVAVLPFIAMSDGPDDEFFADGLTEEILNSLAQLPELLVTARTSAFVFKGDDMPPIPEIAARLGVRHVVEGSVRRAGERLRVTAQLIRADDGFHLWSNNYDSTSADTIYVQENIAEKIAVALDIVLDDDKREAMRRAGLRDAEAFTLYQKGLNLFNRAHGEIEIIGGLRAANVYFDQVIARAPGFADVYARHADLYTHILTDDVTTTRPGEYFTAEEVAEAYPAAVADLQAAVEYTVDRDDRLVADLDLAFLQGNWRGLIARTERALDADVCEDGNWMPSVANTIGLSAKHAAQTQHLIACDPLRSLSWFNLVRAHLWTGNYEEALRVAREGREVAPGNWLDWIYVRALIEAGKYDEAQAAIDSQMQLPDWAHGARALLAAKQGDRDAFDAVMANLPVNADTEFFSIMLRAWGGRRGEANALAARYDEHPFGPWALWQAAHWCACGHPFDLDVTPNFARMIEDADLPWPPGTDRVYPLKDW